MDRQRERHVLAGDVRGRDGHRGRSRRAVSEARSAVVAVAVLTGAVIEIECVAAVGRDGDRVVAARVGDGAGVVVDVGRGGVDLYVRQAGAAALGDFALDMDGKRERDVGGGIRRGDVHRARSTEVIREAR